MFNKPGHPDSGIIAQSPAQKQSFHLFLQLANRPLPAVKSSPLKESHKKKTKILNLWNKLKGNYVYNNETREMRSMKERKVD